jgi:hypothetical protein
MDAMLPKPEWAQPDAYESDENLALVTAHHG